MKRVVLGVLALSVSSALMAATPKFDGARISADVKELASDAYEGGRPGHRRRRKDHRLPQQQFADAGLQPGGDLKDGKRLWTQAVPLRKGDIVGAPQLALHQGGKTLPLEQGKQIAVRAAMNGASASTSARRRWCSRLRREGAGAQLGRLQGRGPEGQDRRGADQRPGLRDRRQGTSTARA
jgi:hypothetical protein